jgi:hypothetical protein
MNRTILETIPHNKQKYPTLGDWYRDPKTGEAVIRVSDTGDWRYDFLITIHELVEAALCNNRNISEDDVTKFDLEHLESDDPGFLKEAPYYKEHQLGVNCDDYEKRLEDL